MSSEWMEYCIDELKADKASSIAIGPFGSRMKSDCYVESGVRVVRGTNLTSGREFSGEFVFVTSDKAAELGGANLDPFDLVFPHRGAIGEVGIVPDDGEQYVLSSSLMKLKCHQKKADPLFIYYFFKSDAGRFELLKNSSQVGTPGIGQPLTSLKGIRLKLPLIEEQRRIAAVLGAIDDRIALLRESNATLEAIAQALFKSWFVDFDPVHARARGEQPAGLAPEVAALFPDSFEESDLGKIPKGWTIGRVEDLMELAYGKALKATARIDGPIPVYGSGGITGYHNESLVNGPSIIVGRKGTVGSLYWEDLPFFPIDTVFYVKTQKPQTYCFYLLQRLGLKDMNTDAAVPGLNRNNVYRLQVLIPPEEVLAAFDNIASVLRHRIFSNNQQSQTLANLRDTLLPRLISGQLRLPDAEAMVSEAQA
ncbi:restriction endonuclease subunit S [Aeromonas veronii]|uniref:restriction endonuclease subunit S n=1 Tax=Aeromonas veronii TaxID=654 RepID=UPI0030079183